MSVAQAIPNPQDHLMVIPEEEVRLPAARRLEILAGSGARTQLRRCTASIAMDRRRRSTACGCVYHPLEVQTEPTGRYAPCGHDVDEGGSNPVWECDLHRVLRPADARRWQAVLGDWAVRLAPEHLEHFEAAWWSIHRQLQEVRSRPAAAYYALIYAMVEDAAAALVVALLRHELREREGGAA